jgi:DNA-binding NarL/FixJ family response regulator
VLAEDSVLLREGLVRLLTDTGFEVVAAVADAESFPAGGRGGAAGLVVVDVRMPPTFTDEGVRAALVVREQFPDVAVVVLSQYVEENYATDLVAAAPAVWATCSRTGSRTSGTSSRRCAGSPTAAPRSTRGRLPAALPCPAPRPAGPAQPPRERGAATHGEGRSNTAIAHALVVSEGAVEKHVSNIFAKLDLPPAEQDHRRVLAVLRWLEHAPDAS